MKKAAGVTAVLVVIALGIFLFGDSSSENGSTLEAPEVTADSHGETEDNEPSVSVADEPSFTRDEFDRLSQEQQDEMLEEFVLDFWEKELGLLETDAEENNLSLEIFARPYMHTLTEREYLQLSPEDRKRADAEIEENMREMRKYGIDVAAEAESLMADKEYVSAEAYLIYILQMGRELGANKEGLVFTRALGVGYRRAALRKMVKLYTLTGDNSMVQMAREQLAECEEEMKEIRTAAKQREANN
ncbi:MAG: hypothetical protein ACYSWW_13090 [Planctomycetota bacterium]|jgi:hypothetical protein